ncbi:ATP-binding protein [Verminephrobacter eiseniae]|uniref:ATP-binding protein n=1 Tax=Verminephrobacter eiseniae TaxID=364317 RepID=UPI0022370D7A|nr:ATP-binding protein [Verminephrobacter eiseniae]
MTTVVQLTTWLASGESATLEFKKSTAEKERACRTLCAFANGQGGRVLFGVTPAGKAVGQTVSDRTLEELAQEFQNFELPLFPAVERMAVAPGLDVLAVSVARSGRVTSFRGVAYERVLNTTRVMPRETYQRLLLEEKHSTVRWENQPAVGVTLDDLDKEEILRTRQMAIDQRRLSAGTSMDVGDILDRLGLRVDGQITQAAQILYGTKFLPHYPQALLKLGRFRGTRITGDILDNKQEHLHAFAAVREAVAWLDRTLPLAAHFPKGSIFREDRLPVPAEALRETIVNAVIHRDYSLSFGHVAIAVFDDRIEVRSVGEFPAGINAAMLSREHPSVQRNPLMAGAFHRTGAVEVWGRGTNRVIEACHAYGVPSPDYAQVGGVVTVTFRVALGPEGGDQVGTMSGPSRHHVGTMLALSRHQVEVLELAQISKPLPELMGPSGRSDRTKFRDQVLRPLLDAGLLEMTLPDKPRSPNQQYRTTVAGLVCIGKEPR